MLLVDTAVVGRLGTATLGGLAVASQVLLTLAGLCVFLAYGTTAAVARRYGAGDIPGGLRDGVQGLWLAVLIGIGLALGGWAASPWLVEALGASENVAPPAITYLRISLISIPALLVILAGTGVLRGLQDARTPLVVAVGSNVINAALCVLFALGLGWGIAGAAWATVAAQGAGAVVYLAIVLRAARRQGVSVRPVWAGVRRAATAGFALLLRTASLRIVLLVTTAVAARLGDAQIAAHHVAMQIWSLLVFAMDAIAIAGQAIIGRYLGAADVPGTRAATRRMLEWGVMLGLVFGVLVITVSPWAAIPFGVDAAVAHLLIGALLVVAIMQPLSGVVMVLDGILMGAGDQRYLAWASLWAMIAYLPCAAAVLWLVPHEADWSLTALWVAFGVWIVARGITLGVRTYGDTWLVTGASR